MMIYKFINVLILMILFSCSTYDCSKIENMPCGTLCEQAKIFVEKLLKNPNDWICILQNEKCIDCTEFLNRITQYKNSMLSAEETIYIFSKQNCKIVSCFRSIHKKMKTTNEIEEDTQVIVVRVSNCDSRGYNPNISGQIMDLDIKFKIINEEKLKLFLFWW